MLIFIFLLFSFSAAYSQNNFYLHAVSLYNVENLFDTLDNPNTYDDARTPKGKDKYTSANLNRKIIDSIQNINDLAKIIIMDDFNDDPVDKSIKKVLLGKTKELNSSQNYLYNPMEELFKKGLGTLKYQGKWNLFDQIIISSSLLSLGDKNFVFLKLEYMKRNI